MLLDIGVGIILGIVFDMLSDTGSLMVYLLVGIFAALAPDIDFIYHLLRGGTTKNDHRHREVLHNPLFLIAGWLLFTFFTNQTLAWLFAAGVLAHFVHDSIGIGWGVQWLWPFKDDHYTFLYRVHTAKKPKPPKKLIYVWPNKHLDDMHTRYGDPEWFINTYLHWHPYAIFEASVFCAALVLLAAYVL